MTPPPDSGGWFHVVRPKSYWNVLGWHLTWFAITGAVLVISVFMPYQTIPFRICAFYNLTEIPCMFCGYTRSFAAMSDGAAGWAIRNSPMAVVLWGITILVFLWNGVALAGRIILTPGPRLTPSRRNRKILLWIFGGLIAVNWAYRLAMGFN